MTIPWQSILTMGLVPLVKWAVKYGVKRNDERKAREAKEKEEAERRRLKAQTYQRIREAKENYEDIDPSKYEV